jgi:hypothetical protein
MESIRTVDLKELRARVAAAEYVVDEAAVADAIVRRALGGGRETRSAKSALPFDVRRTSPRAV